MWVNWNHCSIALSERSRKSTMDCQVPETLGGTDWDSQMISNQVTGPQAN